MEPAVYSSNHFAVDLYHRLGKEKAGENLFFSPYSMTTALAMTAEGARAETALQMGRALCFPESLRQKKCHLPWDLAPLHTAMAQLHRLFNGPEKADQAEIRARIKGLRNRLEAAQKASAEAKKAHNWQAYRAAAQEEQEIASRLNDLLARVDQYELRVANALWAEKTYPFKESYLKTIAEYYGTGSAFPADFRKNFQAERVRINRWVEEETSDRIRDLIPAGALDPYTRLVLTNAIFFKGEWSRPFQEKATRTEPFTLSEGTTIQVPMMNARALDVARYAAFQADGSFFNTPATIERGQKAGLYPGEDGFSMVELPYKGGDLAMVIIAPNRPGGMGALEKGFTTEDLDDWIDKLQERKVHVSLPNFKQETSYEMKPTLQALGMDRAFVDPFKPNGAQFGGMTTSTDPLKQLYITQVMHKAFVEVNEKGTEAAAATAVIMARATAALTTPFIPAFKADRPFIYLIRDRRTGTILFLGRMMNPQD